MPAGGLHRKQSDCEAESVAHSRSRASVSQRFRANARVLRGTIAAACRALTTCGEFYVGTVSAMGTSTTRYGSWSGNALLSSGTATLYTAALPFVRPSSVP